LLLTSLNTSSISRIKKKLAHATVNTQIGALHHFYEINDVELKWSKINQFKEEYHSIVEDRPYTREEIKTLVDRADLRSKAIILLMASSGIRIGAIPGLRIRDLLPIDKDAYSLYQITVYKKSKAKYTTFCTPECRKVIDEYIKWRESAGEQIKSESPLSRKSFDREDLLQAQNNLQPLSVSALNWTINTLLHSIGVRRRNQAKNSESIKKVRREVMQAHVFASSLTPPVL
jgi:integrase